MESRAHLNHAVCRHCFGTGELRREGVAAVECPECLGAGAMR
ncbi:MAG: hypothetical protein QOE90_3731 [Thermoplasmata archaeon]|jgi:DnaJ-class molecular chaperone|nr:hypothetical protein [Thermoplasmata archaeon]